MSLEIKIAHLGFIQGVINRMGNNSFLVKGWFVTLMTAVFALTEKPNACFVYLAILPLVLFWWLDAFLLHQEKLYRKLYEKVVMDEKLDIFTMKADKYKKEADCFFKVFFSKTLIGFYGGAVLISIFTWKLA